MKAKKRFKITDAEVSHVSYVKKAANGRKFFLTKEVGSNNELSQEEVAAFVTKEVKPVLDRIEKLKQSMENMEQPVNKLTANELETIITEVLEPINNRLKTVEKTFGYLH